MIHVIDDDSSVRKALMLLAKSADFQIDAFDSADEFLKSGNFKTDDCLILDIHMPGKNGFDLLEELKLRSEKFNVIILTAYDEPSNRKLAQEYGVKAFFKKPCDSQALIDTLNFINSDC